MGRISADVEPKDFLASCCMGSAMRADTGHRTVQTAESVKKILPSKRRLQSAGGMKENAGEMQISR
jgi:hypothetical protein